MRNDEISDRSSLFPSIPEVSHFDTHMMMAILLLTGMGDMLSTVEVGEG